MQMITFWGIEAWNDATRLENDTGGGAALVLFI